MIGNDGGTLKNGFRFEDKKIFWDADGRRKGRILRFFKNLLTNIDRAGIQSQKRRDLTLSKEKICVLNKRR